MKWYTTAAFTGTQPKPVQDPQPDPSTPGRFKNLDPTMQTRPKARDLTSPLTSEQFYSWMQKYQPGLWDEKLRHDQLLEKLLNEAKQTGNYKKHEEKQKQYQAWENQHLNSWKWQLKQGTPEEQVLIKAKSWLDMLKSANSLDLNTNDLNIPSDDSMPPNKNKMRTTFKKTKKPVDPDHKVPGLSQEPPLGQK